MLDRYRLPSAPDKIYSHSLQALHLGRALWYPEPHTTGEPQIGDLGFISDGAFVRLFNLNSSASEHAVTFWQPPFTLAEPLPPRVLRIDRRARPLVPNVYVSHGVERTQLGLAVDVTPGAASSTGVSAEYTCRAAQGAALELKSEAESETIFDSRVLKRYIARNHDRWLSYVRDELDVRVGEADLVMVSGWVKTEADWATAAFSNMSSSAGVSLDGQAGGAARIRVSGSYTYSAAGPMMERQGCHYAQSTPTVHNNHSRCRTKDQCVFIKRYMVRRRFYFMRTIVAGAGYHDLPRGDNGNDGGSYIKHINGIEPEPARNMFDSNLFDPLSVLIYYIFETTAAEVAVVSDHDINIILDGQRIIDFASYLRKSQPPVEVDGPFGFICAEDVVSRERETSFSRRGINARDLQEWPASTFNGAASLETKRVLVGAPPEGAIPFKCHQLAFSDPLRQSTACTCCALSLDGNLLAASFDDSPLLYIWRIHDGLLLQRLEGHTKDISCITFAASGDAFVSGSADSTAIVWDTRHRRIRHHLEGHDGDIEMVAFSPCSSIIVTGSTFRGDCLKLWDAETGACLHSFTMLKRDMHTLQFSPDSSRLYIGLNYSCLIYNLRAHKHVAILRHRYGKALHWVLSRAGDRIVTATQPGGEVKIWCAITGSACLTINHPSGLTSPVEFAPDGAEVVACCDEGKALVCYDARTGQPRHVFTARHKIQCLAYSQDGQYLIVGDEGGDLQVFDAKARGLLYTYQAVAGGRSLKDTNFLPDSRSILVRSASGPLGLLNLRDAERLR